MMLPIFLGMVALLLSPPASAIIQGATPEQKTELKRQAGYMAVEKYVKNDMIIGLGTGSTAEFAVERVGQLLDEKKLRIQFAVPTSEATKKQAEKLGIPLKTELEPGMVIDVAIDGADSVDPQLNLVKGGGGAHFREKIVEAASRVLIVIVDDSKMTDSLGPHFPVPVEVVPFCHEYTAKKIEELSSFKGCVAGLRRNKIMIGPLAKTANDIVTEGPLANFYYVTDNGNYIVDMKCDKPIKDPVAASRQLRETIGVVEHGFFTGMTTEVLIAGKGTVKVAKATDMSGKTTWAEWFPDWYPEGSGKVTKTRAQKAEESHLARIGKR